MFGYSKKKKTTKRQRLAKTHAQIRKLEAKRKLDDDFEKAQAKLRKLRGR